MAGVKISNLPAATTPLAGTELVPLVQGGVTVKATPANINAIATYTGTGTGAVSRLVSSKLGDFVSVKDFGAKGDGVTDDTAAFQAAAANKILNTTDFNIPIGIYPLEAQVSVTAYNNICGSGDTSQVKVSTGTAFAFTSQSGVFDDHPHNFAEKMRITGNGIFAAYPNAQTGTTVGYSYSTVGQIGNFASCYGMTYELHDTGRYIKSSYTHNGNYNYYRANKVGLKLEETTSFTESNSYFRYNSTAAIQIIGGQNITIRGGAIEGNSGAGLLYSAGAASWGQLNLQDCYFESNGNEATGVWSIDVPFGSPIMVNITGGSFWRNIASGITSGPYMFGDNVTLDGATINGSLYAKYARVRNTRGNPNWNTSTNETTARLFGLTEPVIMLEYSPVFQEYNFVGATGGLAFSTLLRGRGSAKIPGVTNLINTTYPYSYGASSGATSSANAALNYGEGDFFKVQYGATVGNFSSNYATLHNFTDITKPYRVVSCIAYPEADCEIAIVQSVGGQSLFVNYALKANTYYKLVMCGNTPMTAGSFLRIYPINTAAPAINFLPMWASQHATHKEQLLVLKKLVDGEI